MKNVFEMIGVIVIVMDNVITEGFLPFEEWNVMIGTVCINKKTMIFKKK
jgi:hypothetical protein